MKWTESGIFLIALVATGLGAPILDDEDQDSLRLPKTSYPTSYDLSLTFSVNGKRSYEGSVSINIVMTENTSKITLHNRGLAVLSVKLIDSQTRNELEQTYIIEDEKEFIHIVVSSRELIAGDKLSLTITFSGQLQTGLSGFYRSSYRINNSSRWRMQKDKVIYR